MSNNNDKLDMHSPDLVNQNIEKIAALFPNCLTESAEGKSIDFDLLKQELSYALVEGAKERYRIEWPGKREAIVTANLPTNKTLRPVREDSVDFDNTENIYIEGDNLEVLKLLQESYLGKIKMIYIDPPYNTGNDFVYKDNFAKDKHDELFESGQKDELSQRLVANPETSGRYHSDWLSMMYPRLKLARNLLKEDGLIFISIDDTEAQNLKKICDEVFGEINFIGTLIRQTIEGGKQDSKTIQNIHEYTLVFCKNMGAVNINKKKQEGFDHYTLEDEYSEKRGRYYLKPLENGGLGYVKTLDYPISGPNNEQIYPGGEYGDNGYRWVWSKDRYELAKRLNLIVFIDGNDGKKKVYYKIYQYMDSEGNEIERTVPFKSLYLDGYTNRQSVNEVKKCFDGKRLFDYPKPVSFIKEILEMSCDNSSTILDFFSGSSTTAQAMLEFNAEKDKDCNFIMVQLPEKVDDHSEAYKHGYKNICEIGKERIRRAAKKIKEETGADIDYGFRVYRLDETNMQDVYYRPQDYDQAKMDLFSDNVKPDRTEDDLLAQVMLDWGLPLNLKIEQVIITGKKVFKVSENSFFACFDKGIDEAFAKEIVTEKPLRIVFKDAGFKDDNAKTNVKQLLKQLSPETEMKVL
jgi:adenine-specific DNA-methyltransferase